VKGSVVWQSDVPIERWFVVVEKLPASFDQQKWEDDNRRRTKNKILPKGLGEFCVVETPHIFNKKTRQIGPYIKNKQEAIEKAQALNGDMLILYVSKGVFLD